MLVKTGIKFGEMNKFLKFLLVLIFTDTKKISFTLWLLNFVVNLKLKNQYQRRYRQSNKTPNQIGWRNRRFFVLLYELYSRVMREKQPLLKRLKCFIKYYAKEPFITLKMVLQLSWLRIWMKFVEVLIANDSVLLYFCSYSIFFTKFGNGYTRGRMK